MIEKNEYTEKIILENIRQKRQFLGYTQECMAFELNTTQKGYSMLERGKVSLTVKRLLVICRILDISINSIFSKFELK